LDFARKSARAIDAEGKGKRPGEAQGAIRHQECHAEAGADDLAKGARQSKDTPKSLQRVLKRQRMNDTSVLLREEAKSRATLRRAAGGPT